VAEASIPSNFVLSAELIEPAADVVAAEILIAGVDPPDELIGAEPVTEVTPPAEPEAADVILPCASTVIFVFV